MMRLSPWEEPRVFAEIQRLGAVAEDEMDRVFNRGVGMALVVDVAATDEVLAAWGEAYWMLANLLIAAEAEEYQVRQAA